MIKYACLVLCFAASLLAHAVDSEQNNNLMISPVMNHFGPLPLGTDSPSKTITVTNNTGARVRITAQPSIAGTHANQFTLVSEDCPNRLNSGASCTITVRFSPTSLGSKMAYVSVGLDNADTPVLTAFLSNEEDVPTEAERRFPPVLTEVKVLQGATEIDLSTEALAVGQSYTLKWKMLGYDDIYTAYPAFFDCGNNVPTTACGSDFNARIGSIDAAEILDDTGEEQVYWRYQTENAKYYEFSQPFTITSNDIAGSAGAYYVALRFYYKNATDIAAKDSAISLLAPANILGFSSGGNSGYVGSDGRRLYFQVNK